MNKQKQVNSLKKLFQELNIVVKKDTDKLEYVRSLDVINQGIPLEYMSDEFKNDGNDKNIYLNEIVHTMNKKKKISATTQPNILRLIDFYAAIERVTVDEDYIVEDTKCIFRREDKFCYRLVKNLMKIFSGIEYYIVTQKPVSPLIRQLSLDIAINISDTVCIGIEFDEKSHSSRDKEISDNVKRDMLSRIVELRIVKEDHDFDHFLKSICYDIINLHKCNDLGNEHNKYVIDFIKYNIHKTDGLKITGEIVASVIELVNCNKIDVDMLANDILNVEAKKIISSLEKFIRNRSFDKDAVIRNNKNKITDIKKQGILKFLMLFDDQSCRDYRDMFDRVIREYISILSGSYNDYKYICPIDRFSIRMKEEARAYSNKPYKDPNKREVKLYVNNSQNTDINTSRLIKKSKKKIVIHKNTTKQNELNSIIGVDDVLIYDIKKSYTEDTLKGYLTRIKNLLKLDYDQVDVMERIIKLMGKDGSWIQNIRFDRKHLDTISIKKEIINTENDSTDSTDSIDAIDESNEISNDMDEEEIDGL